MQVVEAGGGIGALEFYPPDDVGGLIARTASLREHRGQIRRGDARLQREAGPTG